MAQPTLAESLYPDGPSNILGNDDSEDNFKAADSSMKLTAEEKSLYKQHLNNLKGPGGVDNDDGSRSTLFATTVGFGDKTYIIPTVANGRIMSEQEAIEAARKKGIDKFPSYDDESKAKARYDELHSFMEKDTFRYLKERGR